MKFVLVQKGLNDFLTGIYLYRIIKYFFCFFYNSHGYNMRLDPRNAPMFGIEEEYCFIAEIITNGKRT